MHLAPNLEDKCVLILWLLFLRESAHCDVTRCVKNHFCMAEIIDDKRTLSTTLFISSNFVNFAITITYLLFVTRASTRAIHQTFKRTSTESNFITTKLTFSKLTSRSRTKRLMKSAFQWIIDKVKRIVVARSALVLSARHNAILHSIAKNNRFFGNLLERVWHFMICQLLTLVI